MNLVKADPKQNGWVKQNTKWFFYKDGALIRNNWAQDSKKLWYYLGEDGAMVISKWIKWKEKWYYLGTDGVMQTGWVEWKGKMYFLEKDGSMLADTQIDVGTDGAINP
jgi:glucan-binding YG repeat protein